MDEGGRARVAYCPFGIPRVGWMKQEEEERRGGGENVQFRSTPHWRAQDSLEWYTPVSKVYMEISRTRGQNSRIIRVATQGIIRSLSECFYIQGLSWADCCPGFGLGQFRVHLWSVLALALPTLVVGRNTSPNGGRMNIFVAGLYLVK